MEYYKLIDSQTIVGAIDSDCFRKYQAAHNIIIYSNIIDAQLAQYKEELYRDDWLRPISVDIPYKWVKIIKIDKEEYDALIEALETEEEIIEDIPEEILSEEDAQIDEDEINTLEYIKEMKIRQMSKICHDTIVKGVDVVLSDGNTHHFSLEIEDQIKIQALALKAQTTNELLPWHEDNKPCQFYSPSDIMILYNAMEDLQVYHTTYFNSLKMYILSLNEVEDVAAVVYGIQIPVEYQSDVLKFLLAQ